MAVGQPAVIASVEHPQASNLHHEHGSTQHVSSLVGSHLKADAGSEHCQPAQLLDKPLHPLAGFQFDRPAGFPKLIDSQCSINRGPFLLACQAQIVGFQVEGGLWLARQDWLSIAWARGKDMKILLISLLNP